MPRHPHPQRERWKQFLSFVAIWVPTVTIGTALVFYLTARPGSPREPTKTLAATAPAPVIDNSIESDEPEKTSPPSEPAIKEPPPARSVARASGGASRAPSSSSSPGPSPRPSPRPRMSDAERASQVAAHIRRAAAATDSGDYDAAVRAYERALELDPNNFEVKILMTQVESLGDLEVRNAGGPRFRRSATELSGTRSAGDAIPAELIIEILPAAPNPGDPYILRVRAHNASNQSLGLKSVELVDTHDSMKNERARPSTPLAQQLGPNEVALLWERRADWSVADRSGVILVAVTLADGSRLSKSLEW